MIKRLKDIIKLSKIYKRHLASLPYGDPSSFNQAAGRPFGKAEVEVSQGNSALRLLARILKTCSDSFYKQAQIGVKYPTVSMTSGLCKKTERILKKHMHVPGDTLCCALLIMVCYSGMHSLVDARS